MATTPSDIDELRRLTALLLEQSRTGVVDTALLAALDKSQREICSELESRRRRIRQSTQKQVETVEKLLALMQDYEPEIVLQRIRSKLRVGRSRAYKLRKLALGRSPLKRVDAGVKDSDPVEKRVGT